MTIQLKTPENHVAPSTIFISGSRKITTLPTSVLDRLATILDRNFHILIGDAHGVDYTVQTFLADRDIAGVTVYCADAVPRLNAGNWDIETVPSTARKGTAAYHAEKDRAMAQVAMCGLVIWDGRSRGSLANIHRMAARGCFIVIWLAQQEQFVTLRSDADRESFLLSHPCRT